MKKIILMLLCLMMIASCRSATKIKSSAELERKETFKTDTNIVVSEDTKVQQIVKEAIKTDQKEKENEGEIVIKGKTDSATDFTYHNIIGKDTISDIYIKGNADFIIINRYKNNEKVSDESKVSETINFVAKVARKAVAQSTIKEVAEEIKGSETTVKSKGFGLPVYLISGAAVLLIIFLFFFSKHIPNIQFWKRKN